MDVQSGFLDAKCLSSHPTDCIKTPKGISTGISKNYCLRCFEAIGWEAGRTSGLWLGAGMVICLGGGADLHMAQVMSLSLSLVQVNLDWFYLSGTSSPR